MKPILTTLVSLLALAALPQLRADTLSLAGKWGVALDRRDVGVEQRWFEQAFKERVQLPGAIQSQGFGDAVSVDTPWTGGIIDRSWFTNAQYAPYRQPGNVKVPFWLTPDKYYVGAVWYQRDVEIPKTWAGQRVVLFLERAHWETTVWVDGQKAGSNNSLATPHEYDLSALLTPGKHRLAVRVDNRMIVEVGVNAHSVSDHTQGNWNGIVGRIELKAQPPVWIENLRVTHFPRTPVLGVDGSIKSLNEVAGQGKLFFQIEDMKTGRRIASLDHGHAVTWEKGKDGFCLPLSLHEFTNTWDEFNPQLYRLHAELFGTGTGGEGAKYQTVFGLREVKRDGTQISINGRKIFLRGTLECCIFPKTGHPPTDVDSWKRIVRVCQAHGLNHLRFHSWCPPEAAFQAADELGFYYYVECPSWANQGSTIGDGKPLDQWIYAEGDRMLKTYGNHPSFLMMSYGNEPAGKNHARWLGDLVKYWKSKDHRRLYTSGAGWPEIPENDFHCTPKPRVQGWGQGLKSRINALPPETMTDYRDFIQKAGAPVVSHEIGQWCVYPNFAEIAKYTGPLKAKNFEIFRDSLRAHGMLDLAPQFLLASGKLQTLCYKEDIESALRTPGMAGFELLDLHDFPGQGTALVGVLDPFWDSKGYVTPAEYHRFACQTVPLARLPKRILQNDQPLAARLEVAHFGPADLTDAAATWKLRANGKVAQSGTLPKLARVPTGTPTLLGELSLPLTQFTAATKLNLEVTVAGFANDWDLWVYPATVSTMPGKVQIATALDAAALQALKAGNRVLLLPPPANIKGDAQGRVAIGFSSIFWNTAWTHRQAPHTLGILCDPKHPALAGFPTDYHSNWQWWELLSRSHPFILDATAANFRPVVQVIDDWVTNRKLGLVFEAQVNGGKLLACGIDLENDLANRPVARQLRRSLLDYMASAQFKPAQRLEPEQVKALLLP